MRGDDVVVILTSVGTEEQGLDIAEALVHRRQAACVNMVPSMRSIYRWKGKVCEDTEYILVVKTLARQFQAVAASIREINSYELPEILSFSLRDADARFCKWIVDSVSEATGKRAPRKKRIEAPRKAAAASKRGKRAVQVRK
jgi:periplasmic divalent cation tolerance protein